MADMLRRTLGDGIEVETIVSGGLWNTLVDPAQVESALLNLAINARDAMAAHGRLTMEAPTPRSTRPTRAQRRRHARPVRDGRGDRHRLRHDADVRERVFEPFFTTKPEGQGTGLGLSMVYGFVKQSSGHIQIYSEPGHGTTVKIYLPRSRQEEDLETNSTPPAKGWTETILVVEDEEEVRETAVEMLDELGYRCWRRRTRNRAGDRRKRRAGVPACRTWRADRAASFAPPAALAQVSLSR